MNETATIIFVALSLVVAIEGIIFLLFPNFIKGGMARIATIPTGFIRWVGLASSMIGISILWLVLG